jgi:Transposase and inactivated derivatives
MKVQRYKCKNEKCDYDQQENIPFATGSRSYTHRFAKYVVDLLRGMTLKDVANHLNVTWDTIKEIHSIYLERHYSPPSLKGVRNIGIDEFAVKKGHIYKTIVVDLDTGRILYVGDGKGVEALGKFWKRCRRHNVQIEHVATDLSAAFIASVFENCPDAVHVFDHFHVVKLMNEHLDDIRRKVYNMEKDINKRKVLKGTRYLLLGNGEDIFDKQHKTRLDNALSMNEPLSKAYYLKEQLREIWSQVNKDIAESVLDDWIKQARESKIPQLQKMSTTLLAHRKGILAWYDCHISTGKVEGINNKIKVMKRNAYGFRDERYFTLRLFALHDCRITRNVG